MSEIEPQRRVENANAHFAFSLVRSELENGFQDIVDRRVHVPKLQVHDVFKEYYEAPKEFGSINKDTLMFFEMAALQFIKDQRTPRKFKTGALELCASMFWEQAFIETIEDHNSLAGVDDRLGLIDTSSEFLKHASSLVQKDNMERTQRLLLKSLFSQVMRDIVAGEVTEATKDELLISLRDARSQLKFIKDMPARNGLQGEISVLESIWQEYEKVGDKVVIPSSERGGSGKFRPNETHDVVVLKQRRQDGNWRVLAPIETKRQRITPEMRARYTSAHLAQVAADNTVTISGDHRKQAV